MSDGRKNNINVFHKYTCKFWLNGFILLICFEAGQKYT